VDAALEAVGEVALSAATGENLSLDDELVLLGACEECS
jgi:hypothetical protein